MSDPTIMPLADDFPRADEAQWRALVDKVLKGADFEKRLVSRTADTLAIQPLYRRPPTASSDAPPAPMAAGLGLGWDIRQVYADPVPAEVNAAIRDDLSGGTTSILLQIASPGNFGLPYEAASLATALDGVLLDVSPIAFRAGELTPDVAGSMLALWRDKGIDEAQRSGAFNYDPLSTLATTGALYHPLPRALDIAADLVRSALPMPAVTALEANGAAWHACGASEAQELALILATLVTYLRACEAQGLTPSLALPKFSVNVAVDADQMLGLAKLRALRRLIARLGEACSVSNATEQLFVHADTSERMMTKRDPWVNILRTTMATATAAMGGARSITILPLTWALGRTDAFARRVARNTHHILIEESGLARVGDPAAGSFAIETLTADLAARTWTIFQDIEAKGGLPATLKSNFIADELRKSHEARARLLAEGRIEMTGASAFPLLGNDGITVAPWPVRPMPANQNGESMTPLPFVRMAEPFERLRDAADAFAARTGKAPSLFLATLGEPAEFAARATWIQNVLAAGGITATTAPEDMEPHRTDSAALGRAFAGSGETIACLCATDATYGERGEAAASILKQTGAKRVFVAGRPRDQEVALRAAGVDGFIYAGADRIAILTDLHDSLGVAKVA